VEIPKVGDILTTLPDTRMCPLCVGTKVDYDFAKHCNIHHPDFIKQNVVFAHTGEVSFYKIFLSFRVLFGCPPPPLVSEVL